MVLFVVFFLILFVVLAFLLLLWNISLKRKVALIEAIDHYTKSLMCIVDLNTMRIVSASNSVLEVMGIGREDVIHHDPKEMIHPDDLELLRSNLQTARNREQKGFPKEKVFDSIRIRIRDVDYGWQWYELYAFFYWHRSHEWLCCSFFGVNDQMRVREELLKVKTQMSIMLNNSFNIVWKVDCLTRQFILITPVSRERFGIDDHAAGPLSSNANYFLDEEILSFRDLLNKRISALSESGKCCDAPTEFLVHVKNRDGSVVPLLTRSTLEKDEVGNYILYGVSQRVKSDAS